MELPFQTPEPPFGNTFSTAVSQFQRLEFKLSKNPQLKTEYQNVIKEYLACDHMVETESSGLYIIPHHCVLKESSCTTKVRIVFNASARTPPFLSLNDHLLTGPKLQKDITVVISNFRLNKVALCADIRQMYRQVLIAPPHRKFLHILWRDHPSVGVKEYELKTVKFGVKPSPFLAMRCLHQLV